MPARGPVVLGIGGLTLDGVDRERLLHPLVGGVILFSRNYENVEQLAALTAQIHALRTPALLISVDHEGGRVQRFRTGSPRYRRCARSVTCGNATRRPRASRRGAWAA